MPSVTPNTQQTKMIMENDSTKKNRWVQTRLVRDSNLHLCSSRSNHHSSSSSNKENKPPRFKSKSAKKSVIQKQTSKRTHPHVTGRDRFSKITKEVRSTMSNNTTKKMWIWMRVQRTQAHHILSRWDQTTPQQTLAREDPPRKPQTALLTTIP